MPRRSILSAAERDSLFTLPDTREELIRHYTFNETDMAIIRQHRGSANRLGFAVQLCYMRHPGMMLGAEDEPFAPLLHMVAAQLKVPAKSVLLAIDVLRGMIGCKVRANTRTSRPAR